MTPAPVPPDGEPDTAGIEAAKQAVYESMPVVLKDLVSRSEAEAAIGVPHGAGVPDRWLADVAVRAYLAAGRAAATPDPPDMTNMCEGESPDHKPGITPAASPDERLRAALAAADRYARVHREHGYGPEGQEARAALKATLAFASPDERLREAAGLLSRAKTALRAHRLNWLALSDRLDAPYPDRPDSSPWSRFALPVCQRGKLVEDEIVAALAAADREAPDEEEVR